MSSHHIIRDEQEPPVLVFQLNENWQELSELLGWSPILLINPSLNEIFELRQTKIDGYLIEKNSDVVIGEKDFAYNKFSLVDSLLIWMNTKNCTALNIFCNADMMMSFFNQLENKSLVIPLIFFTEDGKFILKPTSIFRKWYPEKLRFDILNTDIKRVENLVKDEQGYRVEKDGFVKVEVKGKMVLIKEK